MRLVWLLSKRTVKNYDGTIFISDTLFYSSFMTGNWGVQNFVCCRCRREERSYRASHLLLCCWQWQET